MSAPSSKPSLVKSLPMIVDVAVDPQGNTLYHVRDIKNAVQEDTPVSSNYGESSRFLFDSLDELSSSAGTVSSTHLPCMDAQGPPELMAGQASGDTPVQRNSEVKCAKAGAASHDDIWPGEVETAFEEALAIVPKCGLTKIKIAGRLCGRNELIADYILAKTGKVRSRKQVSSHIQVVKNMKLNGNLINLINDGPEFHSPEEAEENLKRFEDVFSKININKSLGLNSTGDAELLGSGGLLRRRSSDQMALPPKRRKLPVLIISVKNISFSIDNSASGERPVALTVQRDEPMRFLSIKENANISKRFPGLEEFSNTNVPLIHNMVNILSPLKLATRESIDTGLKTNFSVEIPGPQENLSIFTAVYLFGEEVLKVNDGKFQAGTDQPFLVKFWKCFFLQLLHLPMSLDPAFRGITVKQVIYDNSIPVTRILPKSQIKAVMLWEFSKVEDFNDAVLTSSRLFLPPALGYAAMTATNSNYSIRVPQPAYKFLQSSVETSSHNYDNSPESGSCSSSSLQNHPQKYDHELPALTRPQCNAQLSFPGVPLSLNCLDAQVMPQHHAAAAIYTPLSTIFDEDTARFLTQDEQQLLGISFY